MSYKKLITPSETKGITFEIDGQPYRLSNVRVMVRGIVTQYIFDLFWNEKAIYGLVLAEGVNLVRQYGFCPLPSLYVISKVASEEALTVAEKFDIYVEE